MLLASNPHSQACRCSLIEAEVRRGSPGPHLRLQSFSPMPPSAQVACWIQSYREWGGFTEGVGGDYRCVSLEKSLPTLKWTSAVAYCWRLQRCKFVFLQIAERREISSEHISLFAQIISCSKPLHLPELTVIPGEAHILGLWADAGIKGFFPSYRII